MSNMGHKLRKQPSLKSWIGQKSLKHWFNPDKVWLNQGTLKKLRNQDIYEKDNKEDN